jgi:hypothetical protein
MARVQEANQSLVKQVSRHQSVIEQLKSDHMTQIETIRLKHAISCNDFQSNQLLCEKNHIFMSGQKPTDD